MQSHYENNVFCFVFRAQKKEENLLIKLNILKNTMENEWVEKMKWFETKQHFI